MQMLHLMFLINYGIKIYGDGSLRNKDEAWIKQQAYWPI